MAAEEADLPLFVPGWEDSTLGNVFAAEQLRGGPSRPGPVSYGSYSGAVPNEKITWGELDVDTPKFVIESDAPIVALASLPATSWAGERSPAAQPVVGPAAP